MVFPTALVAQSLEDAGSTKISLLEKLLGRNREAPELTERYIQMLLISAGDSEAQVKAISDNLTSKKGTTASYS